MESHQPEMDMKPELIAPGIGYRLLAEGERRQDGDACLMPDGVWEACSKSLIGVPIDRWNLPVRRKLEEKPLLNPDYVLATHEQRFDGQPCKPIVTEEDMAWIEEKCGMGSGAWDCIEAVEIITVAWQRFAMKLKGEAP